MNAKRTQFSPDLKNALIGTALMGTTELAAEPDELPKGCILPAQKSFSFSAKMSKKQARELRLLVSPLNRPAQVSPRRKVAWRLVRKWFNRYEKPRMIGSTIGLNGLLGQLYTVTDARITRGGGRTRDVKFNLTPHKAEK